MRATARLNGNSSAMNDDSQMRPELPYEDLHAAIGPDEAARAQLDALRAHLERPQPDPAAVQTHVDALRGVRDIEARIAIWWEDPKTQLWIKGLTDAGL
jgi:hypothetical protein